MNRYLFHTEDGELVLPLEGLSIARCVVDHALSLEAFHGDGVITLTIEGPFTILQNGERRAQDPTSPADLGPAIGLVRGLIRKARASTNGRLAVAFEDGRNINVEPNEDFESWQLSAPGGVRAVCRAGGGVSTWGGAP